MHGVARRYRDARDGETAQGAVRLARAALTPVGDGAVAPARSALAGAIEAIAARGDRQAFALLFAHFAPRVKSYLMRLGAPAAVAEDLAQETMLTVWRKAAYFDATRAEAATWIFTIARNLRIDALRREHRPEPCAEETLLLAEVPVAADERLAAMRREDRLREALKALPAEQAEIVRLAYFQEKPHREIERDLGIPLGTVKSRLRLALTRLRASLGEAT
jgi:RNA polymerase sigma-70 factor (ECF subfamily)